MNNGNYFSVLRPQYHQNEYGGALGGPIWKNRAFFFLAYQGLRNRTGVTQLTPVPAAGQIGGGNFTADQNQSSSGLNGGPGGTGLSTNPIPFAMMGTKGACAAGTPWNVCFAPNGAFRRCAPARSPASLTKATSHGLYFTLAYTYAHALDNASGYESSYGGGGSGGAGTNWVPGYRYLNYGDSDYDARHRFVALYNYEIPLLPSMNDHFLVREFLGGWHVTGTTTLQTGFPVGIFQGGNNRSLWCNGSAVAYYGCNDVPETSTFNIPTLNPRAPGNRWFSAAPFSSEPIGKFGNVKRNFLHGPGFNYTNLEIYKNFPLGPQGTKRDLEVRLESYNTFNHANFANPDGNFSDGLQFGQITNVIQPGTGDPQPGRAVQLGVKLYF